MSRLYLNARPFVVFDAKNRQHREWFADFNRSGAWGRCPVRFLLDESAGDLVTQMQRSLIQHYVDEEFVNAENKLSVIDNKSKKRYNTSIAKQ
jgi:hypothetical protein